jgi:cyclohexyl-isocyanide hydratase
LSPEEGEKLMEKTIGVYLWQNMTMLDVLGPHQFLGFVPGFKVVTFAKTKDPVVADTGVRLVPDHDFSTCPPLDILLVGGGANPLPEMQDEEVMSFLHQTGDGAEYVTSVCTGSLILAEAGLLKGYRATTHWAYRERLGLYPDVEVAAGRVVTDRNRITGGGVTAGIDFALTLIAQVVGPEAAAGLQLMAEYAPQPPTNCGSPDAAPPELVAAVRQQLDEMAPGLAEFVAAKAG